MPRTRSKRIGRRRSRYIRHRGRKTRTSRKIRRRRRGSRRVMRGGVDNPLAGITKRLGKTKRLKQVPPGEHQKEDDDWSLGVFGDSKDKTEVFKDINGFSKIRLMVSFPRAWTATQRSLKIANLNVTDFDRDLGTFFVNMKTSDGFFSNSNLNIKILVEKINENESIISVAMDEMDLELTDEIISQINQVLT